jgi:hypothetical protein
MRTSAYYEGPAIEDASDMRRGPALPRVVRWLDYAPVTLTWLGARAIAGAPDRVVASARQTRPRLLRMARLRR